MIENARTGEQIEFLIETPELLAMHTTWTRPGHRAIEHIHPVMEESFHVLSGRATIRLGGAGGQEIDAGPGGRQRRRAIAQAALVRVCALGSKPGQGIAWSTSTVQ